MGSPFPSRPFKDCNGAFEGKSFISCSQNSRWLNALKSSMFHVTEWQPCKATLISQEVRLYFYVCVRLLRTKAVVEGDKVKRVNEKRRGRAHVLGRTLARVLSCPKSMASTPRACCPAAGDLWVVREPWPVMRVIYKLLIPGAIRHVSPAVSVHTASLLSDWQHTVHSVARLICSGFGLMTCNRGPCVFAPHTQKCWHGLLCVWHYYYHWESNDHIYIS